ncbi:hypothetical protein GT370_06180 [Acidocella sp. MX-AZ03]|uniref:hypothetical protein n=1 Tax=Acidocella sp. MX-AZ03 TaxID=2697363 RepID=UPI0022DD09A5|nr:hypothetical protein [Acidocella sp. MX-AZ03]WBO60382.1 hypothetical protein GT370_06180 [Acidocella sp. MX-AZ03]
MSASMSIGSVGLGSTSNALASVFNSSTSGDTTNVTTLPDGSTVTTVRTRRAISSPSPPPRAPARRNRAAPAPAPAPVAGSICWPEPALQPYRARRSPNGVARDTL